MANFSLHHFLILFLFFHCIFVKVVTESVTSQNPAATNFIKTSCKNTLYPTVCIQSLSAYANTILLNEQQLAQAALSISFKKAKLAADFISKITKIRGLKPREFQAAKDCLSTMNDSVYQLNRSIPELSQSGQLAAGQDFTWHVSNVQTWISAALTDENACLDMFNNPSMDGKIKALVRARVFAAAQVTSNALALVYHFAERH
ncbi:21 kDa protein-like [Nicotiana tabacum]|uniref:21 kDa protein-like n=1 Tax=Nicotiana tabacum TaxID=4097 RepID=A0A1S3Z964_TOBAC|nr:PREDICTED: 21 kDa protein-like [Nicotiana tabacum]